MAAARRRVCAKPVVLVCVCLNVAVKKSRQAKSSALLCSSSLRTRPLPRATGESCLRRCNLWRASLMDAHGCQHEDASGAPGCGHRPRSVLTAARQVSAVYRGARGHHQAGALPADLLHGRVRGGRAGAAGPAQVPPQVGPVAGGAGAGSLCASACTPSKWEPCRARQPPRDTPLLPGSRAARLLAS